MTLLQQRVQQLIDQHQGVRAAGRALGIDPSYLIRLKRGEKYRPSDTTLKKLGLRKNIIIVYNEEIIDYNETNYSHS